MGEHKTPDLKELMKGADSLYLHVEWGSNNCTDIAVENGGAGYALSCESKKPVDVAPLLKSLGGKNKDGAWTAKKLPDAGRITDFFYAAEKLDDHASSSLKVTKGGRTRKYVLATYRDREAFWAE